MKAILRILFFPMGCAMLAGTALIEYMAAKPDWVYWRDYNEFVLGLMWLRRTDQAGDAQS